MRGDKEVQKDSDDEPGSLLDSFNAWRKRVAVGELPGILGLSRPVELKLLDFLPLSWIASSFLII